MQRIETFSENMYLPGILICLMCCAIIKWIRIYLIFFGPKTHPSAEDKQKEKKKVLRGIGNVQEG